MDRFGKNRSETERSRWQPVFRHSNATEIVQEHQPTVWIGFCHLLVTNTVEYPTDRFSKTDLWPICADRNRSMISAIVFRTRSRLPDFERFNGNSILNVKWGNKNGWIGFENASIWSENASICSQNATRRLVSASGRRIGSRTVPRSCLILFAEWQTTFLGHRSVLDRLTRVWMGFREPIHRDLSGFELRGWIGWQCYHF